jgi:hypothetical protein
MKGKSTQDLADEFMELQEKRRRLEPLVRDGMDRIELVSIEARRKALATEILLRGTGRDPRPNDVSPLLLRHLGVGLVEQ